MIILLTIITIATGVEGPLVTAEDLDKGLEALKMRPRADRATMIAAVLEASKRHKVDPIWLLAVAFAESRHNVKISGDKGKSHGPFQMTLGAARVVDKRAKKADLYKWPSAANLAALLWARLFRKYGPKVAPVIYNCGPVRCRKRNGKQRKSTPATRAYWRYYKAITRRIER